jgi:uncharacterized RDD family membrane protein YckC
MLIEAPMARRFVNLAIDLVVCQILSVGLLVGARVMGLELERPGLLGFLTGLLLRIVYLSVLEGVFGRTIGKLLTGTMVVREDGGTPSVGQIIGRTFVRFVPFEPFSFFGGAPNGWHDRWSGTRVVRVRP